MESKLNRQELYLARTLFRLKVHESDNQAFEDLFVKLQSSVNPNFQAVKPQGKYGDRKNDGFDNDTGTYYQVYGPENLRFKEENAVKKLNEDFEGLKSYWEKEGFEINNFFYVVNDKYKGSYPTLLKAIKNLNDNNPGINIGLMRCSHLEDVLISLRPSSIEGIIGLIPNPIEVRYDYDLMSEAVNFLLTKEQNNSSEKIPISPDFDQKIVFNNLGEAVKDLLRAGQRNRFAIEEFFELNSTFTKDSLRKVFVDLYEQESGNIPDSATKSDEVFFSISQKASPNSKIGVVYSVYILMAYYFEYCDIFETPEVETIKQLKMF